MIHNDVARRTAHTLPARSLTARSLKPRTLAILGGDLPPDVPLRALQRPLVARALSRTIEGGR